MSTHTGGENGEAKTVARKTLRVLCVDDDDAICNVLEIALKQQGYEVEHVGDGHLAFKRITDGMPSIDLLVTDHQMPTMIGLQLVEQLRGAGFSGIVVVHSSDLRPKDDSAYRALAVAHIFRKPVSLTEFLAVVERLTTLRA